MIKAADVTLKNRLKTLTLNASVQKQYQHFILETELLTECKTHKVQTLDVDHGRVNDRRCFILWISDGGGVSLDTCNCKASLVSAHSSQQFPSSSLWRFTGLSRIGFVMPVFCRLIQCSEAPTKERPPAPRDE